MGEQNVNEMREQMSNRLYSFPYLGTSWAGTPDTDSGVPCRQRTNLSQPDICRWGAFEHFFWRNHYSRCMREYLKQI